MFIMFSELMAYLEHIALRAISGDKEAQIAGYGISKLQIFLLEYLFQGMVGFYFFRVRLIFHATWGQPVIAAEFPLLASLCFLWQPYHSPAPLFTIFWFILFINSVASDVPLLDPFIRSFYVSQSLKPLSSQQLLHTVILKSFHCLFLPFRPLP